MHPKTLHTLLLILLTTFLVACQEEEMDMTLRQQALLGRAVNFNVSVADKFAAPNSRYTSIDDGSFNENDRMRIYRNYWKTDGTGWESESSYRTYNLIHKYVNGNISLGNIFNSPMDDILNSQRAVDFYNGFNSHMAVEELCRHCSFKERFDKNWKR